MPIPRWNTNGVVPPANIYNPLDPDRSPYRSTLLEFVQRFATTPQRRVLLDGLLRFRADLHQAGLVRGFQWLDDSFLEDIERFEKRPPNDLDLVTFFELPAGTTQQNLVAAAPHLFNRVQVKATYRVDAFFEDLAMSTRRAVEQSAYWYGLYSHQRKTLRWKGFVQIELDPAGDAAATAALAALGPERAVNQ